MRAIAERQILAPGAAAVRGLSAHLLTMVGSTKFVE
jgi:hypothetical protein